MPDWRSAPPKRNLPSQARSIVSAEPARIAPNGQPSPFEKQIVTVSASPAQADGSIPAATEALKSRAPSRWTAAPRARAASTAARNSSSGQIRPPELRCVFSSTTTLPGPNSSTSSICSGVGRPASADETLHDEAGVDRRPAPLVDEDVRPLLGDDLAAGPAEHAERGLVRHRRGREEERRLVPEQLGHAALQLVGGRILALLLVADLGGRHRREHPRRRLRDGVGAEVDHRP